MHYHIIITSQILRLLQLCDTMHIILQYVHSRKSFRSMRCPTTLISMATTMRTSATLLREVYSGELRSLLLRCVRFILQKPNMTECDIPMILNIVTADESILVRSLRYTVTCIKTHHYIIFFV